MHKLLTILFAVLLASAAEAKPNIVVILSDDQDAASIQHMPKLIDLIAQNGLTFTNAFVQFSLCAPSRRGSRDKRHTIMGCLAMARVQSSSHKKQMLFRFG